MIRSYALPVMLHEIAHCRTGDKGNHINASVIAYVKEAYPVIVDQLTVARVRKLLQHRDVGEIVRYELPKLWALNFVVKNGLEGGVNGSLNLDGHGKTLSSLFLTVEIVVSRELYLACCTSRRTGSAFEPV